MPRPSPARRQPQPGRQKRLQGYVRRRWTPGNVGGGAAIVPPPAPAWEYSFAPGDIDTTVSNGDSAFTWNAKIALAAGSISKLGIYMTNNPFNSDIKLALYRASDRVLLANGSLLASAVGFNEIAVTPVVVPAGNYLVGIAALANADVDWSAKTSLADGGLSFAGSFLTFPPDPLYADDSDTSPRICVGAFNTFS